MNQGRFLVIVVMVGVVQARAQSGTNVVQPDVAVLIFPWTIYSRTHRAGKKWPSTISQRQSSPTWIATSPFLYSPILSRRRSFQSSRYRQPSMSLPRAPTWSIMRSACSNSCTPTRKSPKVCLLLNPSLALHLNVDPLEFSGKREKAVSTNERLQQEAQAVLDVIENPDVAQALRQDKNQNLQYLKDNYNVRLLDVLLS